MYEDYKTRSMRAVDTSPDSCLQQDDDIVVVDKKVVSKESRPLLLPLQVKQEKRPLFQDEIGEETQEEQDKSLMYYIKGVVQCLRKRFVRMPLFARILLFALTVYLLSSIVNSLMPLVASPINGISTVLTIIASAIFIYQSLDEKQKKPK